MRSIAKFQHPFSMICHSSVGLPCDANAEFSSVIIALQELIVVDPEVADRLKALNQGVPPAPPAPAAAATPASPLRVQALAVAAQALAVAADGNGDEEVSPDGAMAAVNRTPAELQAEHARLVAEADRVKQAMAGNM
jgi:hypothetical protein